MDESWYLKFFFVCSGEEKGHHLQLTNAKIQLSQTYFNIHQDHYGKINKTFAYTAAGHVLDLYIVNHDKYDENDKQAMLTFLSKYNLEETKERIRLLVSFFTILEISNLILAQNQPSHKIYNPPEQWKSISDGSNFFLFYI